MAKRRLTKLFRGQAGAAPPQALTTPPVYRKTNPADIAIMIFGMHSDTLPLTTIDDYADNFLVQ